MKFSELSIYLNKLEGTNSRIEITKTISEILKKSDKEEIDKVVYLLLGKLAPNFEGIVFNLADKMLIQSIAKAYKAPLDKTKKIYQKAGDIGLVAYTLSDKTASSLTVLDVYNELRSIAIIEGVGSQEKKIDKLSILLKSLDKKSAKFVSRIPIGKLRLGFSDKTILDALSWMEKGDKSCATQINKAYQVLPDVGKLAIKVKESGCDKVADNITLVPFIPTLPMLAQRLNSAQEMIKKMNKVAIEPKFDGLRVLIHYDASEPKGKQIKAFSRNLNDVTHMFPELNNISKYTTKKRLILDSEAIGFDSKKKKFLDFQMTMTRRRKHQIKQTAKDIPLQFQVFDVILVNDNNLVNEPYFVRRLELEKLFKKNNTFKVDKSTKTSDPQIIKKMHEKYLSMGLEGVIVKKLDSKYAPGRTGWRWVKMKEKEGEKGKLADTLDLVIMGFTEGKGKRTIFGIGQFLAGIKNKNSFETVTKVGTGLSEENLEFLASSLNKLKTDKRPKNYIVHKDLVPGFWVKPSVVVEIAADELTISPKHSSGMALRFPRLVKIRHDKSPNEATTKTEVANIYKLQKHSDS